MHIDDAVQLGAQGTGEMLTVARNVSTRYLAIGAEMAIGIARLPFELAGLGGRWGPHTRAVWERA